MKNQNILIVTSEFPPQPGGIGTHAYNLALHLNASGYKVTLISDQRSYSGAEEVAFDAGLDFKVFRVPRLKWRFWMYIKRLIFLYRLLKRADQVIASGKFSLWSVAAFSLLFKRRFLAVLHGSEVNFKQPLLKKSIEKALLRFDTLIAVSHYTKHLVAHLKHPNLVVIPNGYNADKWNPDIRASAQGSGKPLLVTLGNVTERKGQGNVIRLLPELLKTYPHLEYHCVGIPTQQAQFQDLAEALGVAEHLYFHGRLADAPLQRLLLKSDALLMLSSPTATGDVEGFGIAILEANALGIPAIGATHCGVEDAIKEGYSGRLVAFDDSLAFSEALADLLNNKQQYGLQSKLWAEQHLWKQIIKRYLALLSQ